MTIKTIKLTINKKHCTVNKILKNNLIIEKIDLNLGENKKVHNLVIQVIENKL